MFTLPSDLADRERQVHVGSIGAGQFGTTCLAQLERVDGLLAAAVADPVRQRAEDAYAAAGVPGDDVEAVDDAGDVALEDTFLRHFRVVGERRAN